MLTVQSVPALYDVTPPPQLPTPRAFFDGTIRARLAETDTTAYSLRGKAVDNAERGRGTANRDSVPRSVFALGCRKLSYLVLWSIIYPASCCRYLGKGCLLCRRLRPNGMRGQCAQRCECQVPTDKTRLIRQVEIDKARLPRQQ